MQQQQRRKCGLSGVLQLEAKMKFAGGREEQMLWRAALVHGVVLRGWPRATRDGAASFKHTAPGIPHSQRRGKTTACVTKYPPCPPAAQHPP